MANNHENFNAINATQGTAENTATALQNRLEAVLREVRFLSQQATAISGDFEEKLQNIKREFSYLNQQNLSVYNMITAYVDGAIEKFRLSIEERLNDLQDAIAMAGETALPEVEVVVDHERIIEGVAQKLSENGRAAEDEIAFERVGFEESFDYDVLAERIAESVSPVDYDYLADKVVESIAAMDFENFANGIAEKVINNTPEHTEQTVFDPDVMADAVADGVVARLQDVREQALTEKEERAQAEREPQISGELLAREIVERLQDVAVEVDVNALANLLAERIQAPSLELDFEALAENIANKIEVATPEINVEAVAQSVARKVQIPPVEIDYDKVAERILEVLPEVDYEALSTPVTEGVVSVLPQFDYEEVAARLAEKLNGSEEDVEAYLNEHDIEVDETDSSDRIISAVEENSGKTNALVEEVLALLKAKPPVTVAVAEALPEEEEEVEETPVQELVAEPEEEEVEETPVQELVAEPEEEEVEEAEAEAAPMPEEAQAVAEVAVAQAVVETAVIAEEAQEKGKAVRLKRSYECKLRQSSEDVKYYYSEIKNELLSYNKVKSGMSWNGDRFNFGRDTVAKMSINGKTLCLYLALNPDEFSITKYHHKYVGDVKAYESTPMLVKVKSNMGLKKAVALVYEMMEGLQAQRVHKAAVDYIAEYTYKSDEEMIAEGLIKASMTEKKDLNSF